jgi:hypothetical protein
MKILSKLRLRKDHQNDAPLIFMEEPGTGQSNIMLQKPNLRI